MKHLFAIILIVFCISISMGSKGQVITVTNPTNTTPNLLVNYGSLSAAITALNNITAISGPVTITLNTGNSQTAPVGGYAINFATITNTAVSPVTITGSGNTITAFTPQTSGQLYDAIFKIIGADYITIDNFVMQENASNTTTAAGTNNMTEWGVALLYKSVTDGAQNNTIQNNTISLNKSYQNSFGIYSNTRHNATAVTTNVDVSNNTTGPNNNNKVYSNSISNVNMGICFIGSGTAANMDVGNDIGGSSAATANSITNWGGALSAIGGFFANSATFYGILIKNQKAENVSYNTITSSTISGTTTSTRGVYKDYNTTPTGTFTSTITNNIITITDNNASGNLDGIRSDGISTALATATININSNSFINNSTGAAANAIPMTGIINTSKCGVLNINSNIFFGNTTTATTGSFTAISNTDSVQTTLNINNNQVGNASGNAITFSVANTVALTVYGINAVAASTAAVSISNNNIKGIVHNTAGTWIHIYINLYHPASSATTDNINDNSFTNLTANTSGNVTFINRTGNIALNAGATENCNNNKIITAFSKTIAGGTVTLYNAAVSSLSGNTMVETGNDFSNITITGATIMNGWNNIEGGSSGPTKTINNNIFKNWTCGSSGVNVIQSDYSGDNSTVTGNDIGNISGSGTLTVINIGSSNKLKHTVSNNMIASVSAGSTILGITGGSASLSQLNITGNDIHTLTSTGVNPVEAIQIIGSATATITINILKNKIYDLNAQNASCVVYGIDISTAIINATYNIVNNMVGDLKAGLTNSTLAIRGISVSAVASPSTFNIYYNTVYLNASSSGANFGTAALYLTASNTSTIGNTSVRNNIFVNTSTATGTGLTVSFRRSLNQLGNYASSSNNNIFYAGTPSAANLIFYDGTNSDQTLAAFKTRVSTRESNSFTELPPFLSTSGASVNFLHLDPATATQAESGAVNIAGYTDDYDANIRQGNAGYSGTGTAPDIGADEFEGIYSELNPPVITYTLLTTPTCTFSGMTLSGVNITDATGIPLSGANRPRIYYRKNAGSWFSQPGTNTSGTATNSNWSFTIVETDMGTLTGGEVISYYIIAQDINPFVNVGSNPSAGLVATSVNSVTTAPTSPNSYTLMYNLNGTYTVGTGGNFATLTAAVSAYNNACALTGPAVFELIDNSYGSETFPIAINYRADANSTNTLTIRPSATATPVITGAPITQIINLNGARYITFDGRQAGAGTSKSLSFTSTGTGVAFQFINDAQNNTIKYCNVSAKRASNFSGTIAILTAGTGTGNDNNIIDNNDIFDAGGGFSNNGIYSAGTSGKENDNITVTNNNIYNYFSATADSHGVYANSNSSSWTISGNRFYQTATRVYTGANISPLGIYVTAGTGYTISNNVIGFANAAGTGTTNMIGNSVTLAGFPSSYSVAGTGTALRYAGIGLSLGFGTASTVDGNTIGGIAMYTSSNASTLYGIFGGVWIESGTVNVGSNAGNIIGSTTGGNSIYVATSGSGGTVVGIRTSCIGTVAVQNNIIGSITASGTSATISGNFTGINVAGLCNYTVSNNAVGNADADNIRIGYTTSGANLSNAGTLTATNVGIMATVRGINSSSTGNTLSITNNTLRGWAISCRTTSNLTGIESAGVMTGSASVNVNNNFLGTATTNWLNAVVDNSGNVYGINMSNTGATSTNIKDNDIRGTIFGTQNGVGGGLIRLSGATSANNIATISGNTFTNLSFRFTTGDLYFIYTNYSISSTGQLIIDNNKTVGNFNGTGTATYHMISCLMGAASGSQATLTNNDFSNVITATGFSSNIYGIYTNFSGSSCVITANNNTINNWSSGPGAITAIEIGDMTGTATCSNNMVSNITTQGAVEGISISSGASSGQFNVMNNTIKNFVSTGLGGFLDGISDYLPTIANTSQANIYNNTINGFSSSSSIGIVSGLHLYDGHPSASLSFNANKIYDLSESAAGGHVYGIYSQNTLLGNITYSNNYIGDLRAPLASAADPSIVGIRLYMGAAGISNVYYNTIHLNATGSAASFSTAAVYADAATQVTFRNNIFSNVSSHGSSGRTVAYWRGDTNLGTYDAASNNNLLYAGTASSQNLLYYDGTNSDQTLTAFQTRVSPMDKLSVSAPQNFISTTGSNANFLHIAPTGNCSVNAKGSNSGILLATDYDNDVRSTASPFVTDIGADEFSKKNAWTGVNGTNWNDTGNWSEGIVPNTDDDNIVISNPPVNQPVIAAGETYQVASVIIGAGANLTNKGTLKISGSIYTNVAASFNNTQAGIVEGSVEMNGNCSIVQPLAGNVFVNNSVKGFKVSNDVSISAIAGQQLNISGELSFGGTGKTLLTNDNIVLVSTVNKTANVADVTGNLITGKATVERYVNTGLIADGRHLKSWQFLATPTVGQTIFESWQESGTTPAGYGTIITGTGSGFDITTVLPSMKVYDNSTNNWTGLTNTGNLINEKKGYMLFVRGDRSVTAYNQNAVPTNLRTKGTLYQPSAPPPVSTVQAGKFESVGNPYASAIDVSYMKDNGLFVNLDNDVTVWDPLLAGTFLVGGYQTLSASNNYEPTAGGTSYYPSGVSAPLIQSGQAFFVHSSGPAGSVTFNEASKVSSSRLVNRPGIGIPDWGRQYFRVTLFTPDGIVADGNAVAFDNDFSNSIDKDDAYKVVNGGENFGLTRDGKTLAVEARSPVQRSDTIFYNMFNLRKQAYQLRFAPKNMMSIGIKAYLIDKYLHTTTELSLTDSSFIDITINNDNLSSASDRFYVVFRQRTRVSDDIPHLPAGHVLAKITAKPILENESGSISVYPNPVENKILQLHFENQLTGTYRIELVNEPGQPVYNGNIEITGSSEIKRVKISNYISPGMYQLNIYSKKGERTTINVIVN